METLEPRVGMIDVLRGVYNNDAVGEKYVADMLSTALPLLRGMKLKQSREGYATYLVKKIRERHPENFDAATQRIDAIQIEGQTVSLKDIRSSEESS